MSKNNLLYSDFTERNYRELLKLAKQNFKFRFFTSLPLQQHDLLLRHDVDFSPQRAKALAKIESDLQVGSTYFFRLRGADYSILDIEIQKIIFEISSLGHDIGLHFESEGSFKSDEELINQLSTDKNLFELITGKILKVFSFHNPNQMMLSMRDSKYSEMLNAYSDIYFNKDNYVSDSNGYWRFRSLRTVLDDPSTKKLQVLIHPEWWTPEPLSPRERIWRAHIGRANNSHLRYIALLESLGRNDLEKL
jgi:hypothetical protein